ncbi:MAG: hypothetical protein Q9175_004208 [Cornicularia normoerica]
MAVPKQSSLLPAKKLKTKAARPSKATKPSLSTEFVVVSDDSGDAKAAKVKKPASKIARSEPSCVKPVAPEPGTSQAKPSKRRKSPSPSSAEDDSSGSGSGTDSNGQNERRPSQDRGFAAQDGSPTPKPKHATGRPVLAKPSIKPSTNVKPLDQKKERGLGATINESRSEGGGSSEDSSSGSGSGSGSETESGSSDESSIQNPRKNIPVQKGIPQRPTPAYEPPAGFESTSISLHPASKVSEILTPSNLQGKEIWHITAPEFVPISLVKEISTQSIGNGASVLEYHGAAYGLVPGSEAEQASRQALLLPSTQNKTYRPSKTTITKTMNLQQLVSLPSNAIAPAVHPNRSASESEFYRKTPRQQPEGLRMRYRPFGVSDDSELESASEPVPKAPEFRIPAPMKETSPVRKRKRPESNDGSSNTGSAAKSKKLKQSPQITAGVIDHPMDIDAISDKRSTKAPHPEVNGVISNGNETKEERRKRRKEKIIEQRGSPSKPASALPLDVKQHAETIQPGEVVEGAKAVGNSVESTTTINGISPQKESKDHKTNRKKEKRRREEMERANRGASSISAEDVSHRDIADSQYQMMQEIENAQRDALIPIPTPRNGSPQSQPRIAQASRNSTLNSSPISQRREMREKRARRKEEQRRRKMEGGSA